VIRVRRPARVPARLTKEGKTARNKLCKAFARGTKTFEFDKTIYGHETVKRALVKAQQDKCCFCESKVSHIASGHIEHFRPKGGVCQTENETLAKPGYFWLAYEWTNLLFACELCNSRHKRNLFPLADPAKRARRPETNLDDETPLFLDPAREDPAKHLGFREEYPFAICGSRRGEATWRALGLDREKLAEIRRDHLVTVKALRTIRDGRGPKKDRLLAAKLLTNMARDEAPWAAMVRAALV